jgi:hypothetical protein
MIIGTASCAGVDYDAHYIICEPLKIVQNVVLHGRGL